MAIARIKTGLLLHTGNEDLFHGLPFEVWRLVFSFLHAKELCACSQVCKDWRALVDSLDNTRWKELYLSQVRTKRWKHPSWPNEKCATTPLKASWKEMYRRRRTLSRLWLCSDVGVVSCNIAPSFGVFRRRRQRKVFHVGLGKPYHTIKSALDKASPYAKIIVHAGLYQDSSTLYLKFPVAILGIEDPTKVVLMMQIEIRCDSVKLENLTIKPLYIRARGRSPLTTVVRALTGHLCLFNCIVAHGCLNVVAPGSVSVLNCTFTSAFIKLTGVGFSSIASSEFTPNRVAICIEEPLFQYPVRPPPIAPEHVGGWLGMAADEKAFEAYYKNNCVKGGCAKRNIRPDLHHHNCNHVKSKNISNPILESDSEDPETGATSGGDHTFARASFRKRGLSAKCSTSSPTVSGTGSSLDSLLLDASIRTMLKNSQGVIINNVRVSNGLGGVTVYRMGQAWIENSTFHNLVYGIRCLQNSKCILLNNKVHGCETTGLFFRDHSTGLVAGNQIFCNGEAGIDIRSNAHPVVQHNEIHDGQRSGIVCLENGKGLIRENDIYNNKEAAIYILHLGNPKIKNNFICSGFASGIAVTENGRGHITHNVITGMAWAGIDVRHGGNPVISHNVVKNGKSDGIVIGEKGKSVILDNTIEGNSGCGIWILDGSHPLVHSNHIIYSGSNGIAFVSSSDVEHDRQFEAQILQNDVLAARQNDIIVEEGFHFEEDGLHVFPAVPEIEPESRFIHVSKPEKSLTQIESNHVENNRGNGILYEGREGIVISKNRISGNSKHGITLLRSNEITVESNTIRNNLLSGINIDVGVCCTILKNGIYDNKEHGVTTGGLGTLKLNDVVAHALPALLVRPCANVAVECNRLHSWRCHRFPVRVEEKSRVVFEANEFLVTLPPPSPPASTSANAASRQQQQDDFQDGTMPTATPTSQRVEQQPEEEEDLVKNYLDLLTGSGSDSEVENANSPQRDKEEAKKASTSHAVLLDQQQQQQQKQKGGMIEDGDGEDEDDDDSSKGIVRRIGPIPYREGLTVADLCDICDVFAAVPLRPHKSDDDESMTSAPFFTSVEIDRRRGGRTNRSSFCELL